MTYNKKIKYLTYNKGHVEDALKHIKEDPMKVALTEHFLEQIKKRKIDECLVIDNIEGSMPEKITETENHAHFILSYPLDNKAELNVIINIFNLNNLWVISAFIKKKIKETECRKLEFECIYDPYDFLELISQDKFKFAQTIEIENCLNIDFDLSSQPIGLEMINVSEKFGLTRKRTRKAKIAGRIEIDKNWIYVRLKAYFPKHNIEDHVLEKKVRNDYEIKSGIYEFENQLSFD